jgi:hypothetical protein
MIGLPSLRALDGAQGTRIWLATEAVWCGDVADLVEPLYELMAERVRVRVQLHFPQERIWQKCP